jgi:AraC-like DNA-binding protein
MLFRDPDLAEAPIVGLSEQYLPGRVEAHMHRRAQIMFAIAGSMTIVTGRGSWVLPTNRALWIPGNCTHAHISRKPVSLRTLYLDEQVPWVICRAAPAVIPVSNLLRELILAAIEIPWTAPADGRSARLARVLCDQLALIDQEPVHLPEPDDPRARRLTALYYANPAERRSLPVLAQVVGASPRTLERLFRAETGLSLGLWTQQLRLMFALEHLADGMAVGDTAFSVGFENPSSFIAAFRRHFGTTPSRYFSAGTA